MQHSSIKCTCWRECRRVTTVCCITPVQSCCRLLHVQADIVLILVVRVQIDCFQCALGVKAGIQAQGCKGSITGTLQQCLLQQNHLLHAWDCTQAHKHT
jgi:hypothetical protein